jgi:hypothetical protein
LKVIFGHQKLKTKKVVSNFRTLLLKIIIGKLKILVAYFTVHI